MPLNRTFLSLTLFIAMNLGFTQLVQAAIESYAFESKQQEQDYHVLIDELRCLVCQNQNLADSNAELAQDLRKQVYSMLVEQKQDKQSVVNFMVERYGDFVLYNPPLKLQTYLLWGGPFLFLSLGFWWLFRIISQAKINDKTSD